MVFETMCVDLVKARGVNQTSNVFVAKVPTMTPPAVGDAGTATGASVLNNASGPNNLGQNLVGVLPYLEGANNVTGNVRVIGWRKTKNGDNAAGQFLWLPVLLAELGLVASATYPGVTAGVIGTGELFCDTITQTYPAAATASVEVVSNAADAGIAHAMVDLMGFERYELSFSVGTATSCNALVWKL